MIGYKAPVFIQRLVGLGYNVFILVVRSKIIHYIGYHCVFFLSTRL